MLRETSTLYIFFKIINTRNYICKSFKTPVRKCAFYIHTRTKIILSCIICFHKANNAILPCSTNFLYFFIYGCMRVGVITMGKWDDWGNDAKIKKIKKIKKEGEEIGATWKAGIIGFMETNNA